LAWPAAETGERMVKGEAVSEADSEIVRLVRAWSRPAEPQPTGLQPRLAKLGCVRAVLFDIYGTLFVSALGEIGGESAAAPESAFLDALGKLGLRFPNHLADKGIEVLRGTIERIHAEARQRGVDWPEVDIVEVWQRTLTEFSRQGLLQGPVPDRARLAVLAVEFEVRVNPVWPMPGAADTIKRLAAAGLKLGIISNAQFYSLALFPALLGGDLDELGFDPALRFFSFQHGVAKPSLAMFQKAAEALGSMGVATDEALYVGNDMVNDIEPAGRVGFRTGLFAGDARSLRLQEQEPACQQTVPDIVLTELSQIVDCILADPAVQP